LPTYTKDLALALKMLIEQVEQGRGQIFHFSNSGEQVISRFDFAKEIFEITKKDVQLSYCSSDEFSKRAKRPTSSCLLNLSEVKLRDWKEGLKEYLSS
jgi:dTDP-4-dehydrorhamnose reductase